MSIFHGICFDFQSALAQFGVTSFFVERQPFVVFFCKLEHYGIYTSGGGKESHFQILSIQSHVQQPNSWGHVPQPNSWGNDFLFPHSRGKLIFDNCKSISTWTSTNPHFEDF